MVESTDEKHQNHQSAAKFTVSRVFSGLAICNPNPASAAIDEPS